MRWSHGLQIGSIEARLGGEKSGEKTRYIVLHRGLTETTEDTRNTAWLLHFVVSGPHPDRLCKQEVVGSNPIGSTSRKPRAAGLFASCILIL